MRCAVLVAALAALLGAGWYYAAHHTALTGIVPMMHAGIPWGYTEAEMPDLGGKTALLTGGNVGLGRGTAQVLARHGAHVHVTCRSEAKCAQAVKDIEAHVPAGGAGSAACSVLELGSLASVRRWLAEVGPTLARLDILILNAGIMQAPFALSEDGVETQFAVNHLGHFALATGLQPLVERTAEQTGDVRVVSVSSVAHINAPPGGVQLTLAGLNNATAYDPRAAYGQAKLANILFANEWQRRLDRTGARGKVFVNSVHPGGIRGDLLRHIRERLAATVGSAAAARIEDFMLSLYWSEQTGALTPLYPATSPRIAQRGLKQRYFHPIAREWPTLPLTQSEALAAELWAFSEALVADAGR